MSDRIRPGDIFNYEDVKGIFSDLEYDLRKLAEKEIQNAYHANALLVKILLSQAQGGGLNLQVDTTQLENEFLLKAISASERVALGRPASDFVRRAGALGSLGTAPGAPSILVQDPAVVKERDELRAQLADGHGRLTKLQEEVTKVMRERSSLNAQITALTDALASSRTAQDSMRQSYEMDKALSITRLQADMQAISMKQAADGSSSQQAAQQSQLLLKQLQAAQDEAAELRTRLLSKEKEVGLMSAQLDGKLQDTKQFQTMRAMMQKKSEEVVALRRKLSKYEPQDVAAVAND